jgi:tetratricopeptide (TPR) repeat protein
MINDTNPSESENGQPGEPIIDGISLPGKTLRESVITRSAPLSMPKEDAENVAMFRRRVESEVRLLVSPETRRSQEETSEYLWQRAKFMKTPLCAALFKMGMLECILLCDDRAFGFDWIDESLPVLEAHPLTKDMASYYYREAACFAGKKGNWEECLEFARKAVELLPKDVGKILWAPEAHRVLAAAYFKLGRLEECRRRIKLVERLAKEHGEAYGPALWLRIYILKEELAGALGDRSGELAAKLCGISALADSLPFKEIQVAQELRLAWCLHARPKWVDDEEWPVGPALSQEETAG